MLGAAGPGRVLSPLTSARVTQKSWAVLQTAFFWPKISSTTFFFSFFLLLLFESSLRSFCQADWCS